MTSLELFCLHVITFFLSFCLSFPGRPGPVVCISEMEKRALCVTLSTHNTILSFVDPFLSFGLFDVDVVVGGALPFHPTLLCGRVSPPLLTLAAEVANGARLP